MPRASYGSEASRWGLGAAKWRQAPAWNADNPRLCLREVVHPLLRPCTGLRCLAAIWPLPSPATINLIRAIREPKGQSKMKSNERWTRAGIGALVAALAVLVPIGMGAVSAGAAAPRTVGPATAVVPPWEPDNNATLGGIDFYNAAGVQITSGSLTDSPMAAYAIAQNTSSGATKAALFGYLPKSGQTSPVGNGFVDSFLGEQLSASTAFPNTSAVAAIAALPNPVVTGESGDLSVQGLEGDFPNTDTSADGFAGMYQLRIKISAPGISVAAYASTDIMVSATTWTQVYGSYTSPVTGGGGGATATSSVVTANPPSPTTTGTSVTFTATMAPSSAAGTVQFMDSCDRPWGSGHRVGWRRDLSSDNSTCEREATPSPRCSRRMTRLRSRVDKPGPHLRGGRRWWRWWCDATSTMVTANPVRPTTAGTR